MDRIFSLAKHLLNVYTLYCFAVLYYMNIYILVLCHCDSKVIHSACQLLTYILIIVSIYIDTNMKIISAQRVKHVIKVVGLYLVTVCSNLI
jgi:hypothetical protein